MQQPPVDPPCRLHAGEEATLSAERMMMINVYWNINGSKQRWIEMDWKKNK